MSTTKRERDRQNAPAPSRLVGLNPALISCLLFPFLSLPASLFCLCVSVSVSCRSCRSCLVLSCLVSPSSQVCSCASPSCSRPSPYQCKARAIKTSSSSSAAAPCLYFLDHPGIHLPLCEILKRTDIELAVVVVVVDALPIHLNPHLHLRFVCNPATCSFPF